MNNCFWSVIINHIYMDRSKIEYNYIQSTSGSLKKYNNSSYVYQRHCSYMMAKKYRYSTTSESIIVSASKSRRRNED